MPGAAIPITTGAKAFTKSTVGLTPLRVAILNSLVPGQTTNPKNILDLVNGTSAGHGNCYYLENPDELPYLILYPVWEGTNPADLPKVRAYGELDTDPVGVATYDPKNALPKALSGTWGDMKPSAGFKQWHPLPSAQTFEFEFDVGELASPVHMEIGTVKVGREHIVSTRGCKRVILTLVTGVTVSGGPTRAAILGQFASLTQA